MGIGSEALYANRQGVDTAGHNIANAQTEGFSRQRVNVTAREPLDRGQYLMGDGVYVGSISRTHDKFIERQLNLAKQDVGDASGRHESLQSLESIYSTEMAASVSDQLTNFFNALHELAASPSETPVRANVREAAKDLVVSFQRVDENLLRNRKDINLKIEAEAKEISAITSQIATLNSSIASLEVGQSSEANDLRDKRDLLMRNLSEKIDITYYVNDNGMLVVRGPGQSLLVDGKSFAAMDVRKNAETGNADLVVFDVEGRHPRVITDKIEKGRMHGLFDVRDNIIGNLIKRNNEMATGLADNFNAIHRDGFGLKDFKDSRGRDFFQYHPDRAASSLQLTDLIIENSDAISAAATPNAPGDNIIANEMLRLRNAKIMDDGKTTLTENYSNYVSVLGLEIERAAHKLEADQVIYGDFSARREAISGVSLDEEAVNLLKWQTAFAASSKVITTADEMLETILNLKR